MTFADPETFSLALVRAICRVALDLSPSPLPQTTLTATAGIGDLRLTVGDVRPFVQKSVLSWWDAPLTSWPDPEPWLTVLSTTPADVAQEPNPVPGTIQLDFSGQATQGLVQSHAIGTRIATNILDDLDVDMQAMLENGFPVLAVYWLKRPDQWAGQKLAAGIWVAQPTVTLAYHLAYDQPAGSQLATQLWSRNLSHRAEQDMTRIVVACQRNYNLVVDGVQHCTNLIQVERLRFPNLERDPSPTWDEYAEVLVQSGALATPP